MRWMIRVGLGLAVLVLLALGMLALVPSERVAAAVSARFEAMTGRRMVLEGEVTPRLWPTLGVSTGPVSIANADWADSDAPLFRAEGLTIDVNFAALLGGEVRILGLSADRPQINLIRAGDGRGNWDLGASALGGTGGGDPVPAPDGGFTLDDGAITGATIRFDDRATGRVIALDDVDATLQIPEFAGPFTLTATGLSRGQAVALDLSGEAFSAFVAGRVVPLTASLSAGGSKLEFDGRGGFSPAAAEGALTADLSDLPALGALAGVSLADPGPGLGQDRLLVTGDLTLDQGAGADGKGAAYLRGAEIIADGNKITGDLDLEAGGARPRLSAELVAGPITIGAGAGVKTGGGDPEGGRDDGPQPSGWPEAAIDVSGLAAFDAKIALSAASVDLGGAQLGDTRVLVTLDRARAVIDIRQMAAYGGQITGDFVVNGRGGLSVGGRLALAGLQTQPLFAELAGWDRLVSSGDLDLEFLGVGNSIAAIMSGLEGSGTMELGQGELRGVNIVEMFRTLDPGFVGADQRTAFDGLAATFSIAGGVLTNSDLKLVATSLTASGAGEVDLGKRRLDYRIRPTALAAEDGTGGVMVPLLITGPWADPSFRLDLESIAREKMEAEAKAVEARAKEALTAAEDRAKAKLEDRLREELGVEAAPDESLGDAAVRGAKEALDDEARKALEGILGGD